MTNCRCGWDGKGDHPCHGLAYTCRKPATLRFYMPSWKFSLAGAQLKFSVTETWACDECWVGFSAQLEKAKQHKTQGGL